MGLEILTLGSSKTYTRESLLGGGAVVGKNVTISSITPIEGGNKVTFSYTLDDGTVKTSSMNVMDGKDGIDGLPGKDGKDGLNGKDGSDGIGISKVEKIGTVDLVDTYRITFTDNSTFDYEVKNGKDGQGGTGGGEENKIDSISVNGTPISIDENKNVDITVPSIDGLAKTEDIPTKVSELTNDSGYLTEHQDISGKVDKVDGKSLIADTEIERLSSVDNYDDTQVKTQIQTVANGLMDSVGYSADYKTIDIIAKNCVKKSVNVAPIISHASITELSDVDTTNKATGKALVYNATTSKHEYADVSGTDEKVKMDSSTDAKYLGELLDNVTIANENGKLKVKKLDGQEVTITEINYLKGLTMNVMDLVNMFSNGGVKIINTPVATYAELLTLDKSSFIEGISYLVYVLADENHDNAKTTYLVDKDSETPTYFGFADSQRDFVTNPIDLATEITGKLGIANMDSDAIKALFTVDDTYKTETATNNAFSTHGAKALYDELLLAIGNKANDSDLTAHKDDTDIHVSTEDRTKWDSAKTHADSAHAPSDAQVNVLETVKVNNQEITPDENKAVNIDLTGYAEHDEIVGENLIPYPYAQPERTTNGITFTFADDGSVIANGTATENADFSVCVRTNFGTDAALMLKPGIYAITGCPEGGSDSTYRIQVQFGDKTELKYSLKADYGKGFVFEVTEEYAQYACQIQCHVQKGYTVTDLVFKPMLVLGSVLKEYQPYNLSRESLRTDIDNVTELASRVDNQFATASGDYITVNDSVDGNIVELGVKGNSFQNSYSGKNLLSKTNISYNATGLTITDNKNGTYGITSGTTTGTEFRLVGAYNNLTKEIHLDNSKTYKVTAKIGSANLSTLCVFTDGSTYTNVNSTQNLFTLPDGFEDISSILIRFDSSASYSGTLEVMLYEYTEGIDETYEPYVGCIPAPSPLYPQEITSVGDDGSLVVTSCGKNVLKNTNDNISSQNITYTKNSDGSISCTGTQTEHSYYKLNDDLKVDFKGKYILSGNTTTNSNEWGYCLFLQLMLENGTYKYIFNNTPNEVVCDFSQYPTLRRIRSFIRIGKDATPLTDKTVTFYPMLRPYGTDGTYESYKETTSTIPLSEPLRAIGDIKDEITYQDGKWGVLRRITKKIIDENTAVSGIVGDGSYGNYYRVYIWKSELVPLKKAGSKNLASNRFTLGEGQSTYTTIGVIEDSATHDNNEGSIRFSVQGIASTLDEYKTWVADNNIELLYELVTPVFEPFADQTLPYLSTYDGVTNISNDDALSAEMTVKYPTTDASGVGSRNESMIAELAKDTDNKFDDVNESLSVIGKCKNLLNPTLNTDTHNGITFTRNDDGTYSLSGSRTDTSISAYTTFIIDYPLEKGRYKLTGALDENNNIRCIIKESGSENRNIYDYGDGVVLDVNKTGTTITLMIVSIDDTSQTRIIKPMLTTNLSATYDDFVPYTGDGETLTHDVAELKNDLGGLTFSASGTTLSITDGTNTWTLEANS